MVPYDVEAHPFNRAPNASPPVTVTRTRYGASDTDFTGESSRSSVWSVEIEEGSCGCFSGYHSEFPKALARGLLIGFGDFVSGEMIPVRSKCLVIVGFGFSSRFLFGHLELWKAIWSIL
jgi:hypothetical protein